MTGAGAYFYDVALKSEIMRTLSAVVKTVWVSIT